MLREPDRFTPTTSTANKNLFATPSNAAQQAATAKSEFKLTPEGRKVLDHYMTANPRADRKYSKRVFIEQYKDNSSFVTPRLPRGKGLESTVVLSSEPAQLIERMKVLLSSKKAGNNNKDDIAEFSSIIDLLVQKGTLTKKQRRYLMDKYFSQVNG